MLFIVFIIIDNFSLIPSMSQPFRMPILYHYYFIYMHNNQPINTLLQNVYLLCKYYQLIRYNISIMWNKEQSFQLIVTYEEYNTINNQAKELQKQNQDLKHTIQGLRGEIQRLSQNTFEIKKCQEKLKIVSINHVKALKKVLQYQSKQIQLQKTLTQKDTLLAQKEQIVQSNIMYIQKLREEAQQLNSNSLLHLNTIQALRNDLQLKQKELEQVHIYNQKVKTELTEQIKNIQKKCKVLEEQLNKKDIHERIMYDQRDQEMEQLRQKVKQYELQRKKLRKQSEDSIKEISTLSPIIERYYDWLENPESKLLTTFCLTIQHFRQKLIDSKQFQQLNQHLTIKKQSIDKALEKEFKKILQTSTLLCCLEENG